MSCLGSHTIPGKEDKRDKTTNQHILAQMHLWTLFKNDVILTPFCLHNS